MADLTFKPAIWKGGNLLQLPRPVTRVRIAEQFDFLNLKVPLQQGDHQEGRSENGVDITLEGETALFEDVVQHEEEHQVNRIEDLRQYLRPTTPEETYQLFLYHDAATSKYRSFKEVTTVRFEFDLSDKTLFRYVLIAHAADPVLYISAPA